MYSEPIDIKCPECGRSAKFEEPFKFLSKQRLGTDETRPTHQWGGWVVVERFPAQITWQAPSGSNQYLRCGGDTRGSGYPLLTNGLTQCFHCHNNMPYTLRWPQDAYWQWEIRGEVLWAWDQQHAQVILNFIQATDRPSRRSRDLKYIPAHFLSAKIRELVVKKMSRSLHHL